MPKAIIFAQAFGAPASLPSNEAIKRRALLLREYFKAPVVTQNDIAINRNVENVFFGEDYIKERYLSTLGLDRVLISLIREKGWYSDIERVIVVAAPMHIKRCRRDVTRMLSEAGYGKVEVIADVPRLKPAGAWYSRKSSQAWTRSARQWWMREIPIRLLPWPVYKIIAK